MEALDEWAAANSSIAHLGLHRQFVRFCQAKNPQPEPLVRPSMPGTMAADAHAPTNIAVVESFLPPGEIPKQRGRPQQLCDRRWQPASFGIQSPTLAKPSADLHTSVHA